MSDKLTKYSVEREIRKLFDGWIEVSNGTKEHSVVRTYNDYHLTNKLLTEKSLKNIINGVKKALRNDTLLVKVII